MQITDVETYLSKRLDTPVIVSSLHQTFPGMSRETWMVSGTYLSGKQSGEAWELVVRIDPPSGGGVPIPLRVEYQVYQRLFDSPVPVAEVLWYDEGIEFAEGRAHMVRKMVEGSTEVPHLHDPGPEGDAIRERTCYEHAEKLATLHTLDWKAYGFDEVFNAPDSGTDALTNEFEIWKGYWEAEKTDPFPLITEALYWLKEHIPTEGTRVSLNKGNNGIGEEIWKDGKIVAMSDWELAGLGDPCLDWAFSQGMLDLWDRDRVLRHYEHVSGYKVAPKTLAYCEIFTTFKAIVCLNTTMQAFFDRRDRRPGIAGMGLGMVKNMEYLLGSIMGMDDIEEALEVVKGQRTSPYHRE
jgi:aminoglycoside phosphotransferase (APT) family kinase protein